DTFFFAGFFLLASLFNFFFFSTVRERTYLYFALFLLFLCLTPLIEIAEREHPQAAEYITYLQRYWIFFFFHFVRHYFQTFRYRPRWDKFLLGIGILILINLFIVSFYTVPLLVYIINTVFVLSLLITFLIFHRLRTKSAKFFMVAVLPFLLVLAIGVLFSE